MTIFTSYILIPSIVLHFLSPEADTKAVSFSSDQGNPCISVHLLGPEAIAVILKLKLGSELLGGLAEKQIPGPTHRISDSVGLREDSRNFIPKKFPGDAATATLGTNH